MTAANAPAQTAVPPPPAGAPLRSAAELDQLLAPIALYPDPLIAQMLPAATRPSEIVLADRYVSQGGDPNQIDLQPWDASIKALARYPELLKWMDDNLAWTTDVGQVFLYQEADVMNAIQRLRGQASALGNLQSTPQQTILNENGIIEVVPANPEVIYLPVYQPDVVYVERPPRPGFFISFGIGLGVGAWLNHDCDWGRHEIIVWHHDHPRPPDWWYRPPSRRPREVIVNHNVTVWHPHTSPAISVRDRVDRGWETRPIHPAPAPPRAVAPPPATIRTEPARRREEARGTGPKACPPGRFS